ncbi:SDR family oxidoreductase [Calidifontibacter sp. DB0510]|uniref:SDR family oxidoreductase n=1 Tax=Metallococcus carri TaxID=1656884 RepID=A0A967B249_9MICO|nr:SDR family oxidoreductase [Metallococcus carri]NHN54237.1 SDR family oxidoreductase [Metallococcus carri]NOP36923.1 SDR family oxidoreductase [Calidifontibacter sp. DB2511S]
MLTSFDLTGRRALVTGSSKGIGRALAAGLLAAGADVVLNARDRDRLVATYDELEQTARGRVEWRAFDVTDEEQVRAAAAELGDIDILVNNAGMQRRSPITEFPTADFDQIMATNVRSVFLTSREFGRLMVARGAGKIVTVCSVQSLLARPGIAPYCASKGALTMLIKGLCADLAPHGIQVNGLAPGYFDTELTSALVADPEFTAWVEKRTPAGRWGDVADLVGPLVWLSSSASDFVNGQTIYVDGGMTAVL